MNPETLVEKVEDLSVPAPSVVKLLGLLNREEIDNQAVVDVVRADAVLSAKLLALTNSAYFGSHTAIESVDEALFYLGYEQVHRLALAIGVSGLMNRRAPGYAMDEGEFWRHSLLTARAAELLGETMPHLANPSIAYTAGLLHDIGKLVLNQFLAPSSQAAVAQVIEERGSAGLAAERSILGTNHADVGALLLHRWNVPGEIVEAVKNHHTVQTGGDVKLSLIVELADAIAHSVSTTKGNVPPEAVKSLLRKIGVDRDKYEEILAQVAEALVQIETLGQISGAS